jgi:hypothetical protein
MEVKCHVGRYGTSGINTPRLRPCFHVYGLICCEVDCGYHGWGLDLPFVAQVLTANGSWTFCHSSQRGHLFCGRACVAESQAGFGRQFRVFVCIRLGKEQQYRRRQGKWYRFGAVHSWYPLGNKNLMNGVDRPRAMFLNRRTAARYRALALIIPGR